MLHAGMADPMVVHLMRELERAPERRWNEGDIRAFGYDPSTVRRGFRRAYGATFLELARQRRLRAGFGTLQEGGKVIDAQLKAGFDSPAAFRAAFAGLLGIAPGDLKGTGLLRAERVATPLGDMLIIASQSHLHLLEFFGRKGLAKEVQTLQSACKGALGLGRFPPTDQIEVELKAYFTGQSAEFKTPVAMGGSAFAREVWTELMQIPAGETRSYSEVAAAVGRPGAARAVARHIGANPLALIVPCHRVIGADGSLTGYGGGLDRKQKLLELEHRYRHDDLFADVRTADSTPGK